MADNNKLIMNLYSALQEALFLGDGFPQGRFIAFMQPGQFVSGKLGQVSNTDDMAIQADLADVLLDTTFVNQYADSNYSGSAELPGSVSHVYYDIMEHSALPQKELPPATLAQINQLLTWLKANTENYQAYQKLYTKVDDALSEEKHKPAPNNDLIKQLTSQKLAALKNWQVFGQKNTYENNQSQLLYLTSESPVNFWMNLRDQMETSKESAPNLGDYYPVYFEPSIAEWSNDGAWTGFQQLVSESDVYQYSKETGWGGGLSVGWGLWSFGGGASGSTSYSFSSTDATSINVKFEYLRVRINRNKWMSPDVFGYHFWTWNNAFGGSNISDGGSLTTNPPLRPVGRMPVLPEYLILVRNLELTGTFSQQDIETYSRHMQVSTSFGFGPFSVSGSYQESENRVSVKATFDGVTIKIPQPQIIAREGIFIPQCPNPNPGLSWKEDACLPGQPCWNPRLTEIQETRKADFDTLVYNTLVHEEKANSQQVADAWLNQRLDLLKTNLR